MPLLLYDQSLMITFITQYDKKLDEQLVSSKCGKDKPWCSGSQTFHDRVPPGVFFNVGVYDLVLEERNLLNVLKISKAHKRINKAFRIWPESCSRTTVWEPLP